jgi:hypothetical protein
MSQQSPASYIAPLPYPTIPTAGLALTGYVMSGVTSGALPTWNGSTTNAASGARMFFKTA